MVFMAGKMMCHRSYLLLLLALFFVTFNLLNVAAQEERKVYIVYMGAVPKNEFPVETLHHDILEQVLETGSARDSIVCSYKKSFNGFAARLTQQEQQKLSGMEGIVSVFPSKTHKLHTTRSWNFMGFPTSATRWPEVESDVIVGMLDTGIWPESDSFSDEGIGPPPSKWKGSCQNMNCSNKIIGARFYNNNYMYSGDEGPSPRDVEGHGTHTSSTVAGREVKHSSLFHLAGGTARGAVPLTRIAVYKVCWSFGCTDHDIMAAFDDAIYDGVDILSMSLGKSTADDYFTDTLAIGSFHAMNNGILVSASLGNSGPSLGTASNVAPWMLSVAASTIDRRFTTKLMLGNHKTLEGISLNTFATQKTFAPLLLVPTRFDLFAEKICILGSLNESLVEGKILCCDGRFGEEIPTAARGMIMINDIRNDTAFPYIIPNVVLGSTQGRELLRYLNKTSNPVARIHKSRAVFDPKAPKVASFSSRGPNTITTDILKPDITAPGVDILAAWPPKASISMLTDDKRSSKFNIISGTSMSCPHVTGVAAYVKSFHPSWSPAAIRSAIMTTAYPMDGSNSPDYEFGYGAGHIDPSKAILPGLVYDAFEADYIQMLCNEGYSALDLLLITGVDTPCPNATLGSSRDLNYPSMAAWIPEPNYFTRTFSRTVTNVGLSNSKYEAIIKSHPQVQITVEPSVLHFKSLYEKLSFTVTVSGGPLPSETIASSSLVWSNGKHRVRSPIVVYSNYSPTSGSSLPSTAPAPSPSD